VTVPLATAAPAGRARSYALLGTIIVGVLVALALPFAINSYLLFVLELFLVNMVAAQGLNLLVGYSGQIALAHGAFFAVGAYGVGIEMKHGLPFPVALVLVVVITGVAAGLVGFPAMRLGGFYLAIATLGLAVLVERLIIFFSTETGGSAGLSIPQGSIVTWPLDSAANDWYPLLLLALFAMWVSANVVHSRHGRALRAILESEVATASVGISVRSVKLAAFALSGAYAALAGAMYAVLVGYLQPGQFGIDFTIVLLGAVVVGGLGSLSGAALGAAFFTLVPQLLQGLEFWQRLVFGVLIMLCIGFLPGGLVSLPGRLRSGTKRG
jgi:branched-chain amino acid transport system permease protein